MMSENWPFKWTSDIGLLVNEHMLRRQYTTKEIIILEKSNFFIFKKHKQIGSQAKEIKSCRPTTF